MTRHAFACFTFGVALGIASAQEKTLTFAGTTERMATRLAVFASEGERLTPLCQACIQYEAPAWKDEYDGLVELGKGKSLRLGKNFWTTLDTNCDVLIGATKVPAGQWNLGLACSEQGDWSLMVMNAQTVREYRFDASQTGQLSAKINAPLTYAKTDKKAEKLSILLQKDDTKDGAGMLVLTWGNHRLTAPFQLDVAAPRAAQQGLRKRVDADEAREDEPTGDGKQAKAIADLLAIDDATQTFYMVNHSVPKMADLITPDSKGQAYLPGYEKGGAPKDPWGRAYMLRPGEKRGTWETTSFGPDGEEGTEDDISSRSLRSRKKGRAEERKDK